MSAEVDRNEKNLSPSGPLFLSRMLSTDAQAHRPPRTGHARQGRAPREPEGFALYSVGVKYCSCVGGSHLAVRLVLEVFRMHNLIGQLRKVRRLHGLLASIREARNPVFIIVSVSPAVKYLVIPRNEKIAIFFLNSRGCPGIADRNSSVFYKECASVPFRAERYTKRSANARNATEGHSLQARIPAEGGQACQQ